MSLLIYTATIGDEMRPETKASIEAQITDVPFDWEIGFHNPFPGQKMRNVVAQYQRARELCLAGGYDALLTVEHDMILPSNAVEKLYRTDAPVVYGVYMLRHGTPTLNAWRYEGSRNLGMSLSLYPDEVRAAMRRGWVEVCGTGWGCTLIRREVLERLQIHSNNESDAGDITFSTECIRTGIKQIARFDVLCGHILPDGRVLRVGDKMGVVARVLAQENVTVNVEGSTVAMKKGRYYSIPYELGYELQRAGFVQITNEGTEREIATLTPDLETAVATVTKRKPKKNAN